jgi:surface protein
VYHPIVASPNDFNSTWNTELTSHGSSVSDQIALPLENTGTYDFLVDWGDETQNHIVTANYTDAIHTYDTPGVYSLIISGNFDGWRFVDSGDKLKIIEISQWGNISLGSSGSYFSGCSNLKLTATDSPDLSQTSNLFRAFSECESLGSNGSMNSWDVTGMENMNWAFYNAHTFNQNISEWDVSGLKYMDSMFEGASAFNQDIGGWNTSQVIKMDRPFKHATAFNQDIGEWDVSGVTDMSEMFYEASAFNQDIGEWDVSGITNMRHMFYGASAFNQDIGKWDVSSVESMYAMFYNAHKFNQDIGNWDVSSVTSMAGIFSGASSFNQELEGWDVSSVETMSSMFSHAHTFNQDIGEWDVSGVTDMRLMFYGADSFNQDLGCWDVSSVQNMEFMFRDINLSTANYDKLLHGWSAQSLHPDVKFDAGSSKYSIKAASSRQSILDAYNWTISDGGLLIILPPSNIEAVAGDGVVSLLWEYPPNISKSDIHAFYIYRASSPAGPFTYLGRTPTTTFTDTSVLNGRKYYYRVQTISRFGDSEVSPTVSANPVATNSTADTTTEEDTNQADNPTERNGVAGYEPRWFILTFVSMMAAVGIIVWVKRNQ